MKDNKEGPAGKGSCTSQVLVEGSIGDFKDEVTDRARIVGIVVQERRLLPASTFNHFDLRGWRRWVSTGGARG